MTSRESIGAVPNDSQGWFSRIIDSSSISALALLVYEILLTFDDEVELIWTKPGSSFIKWLFLLMRYFGLTSQIGNHLLSLHIASTVPATLHYCRLWYTWRLVSAQVMLAAVETTLILRGQ
ncbi:hypothetical protein PILCRDRAFT_12476 [Piloderma croceum F 1598]|uniref:DUF6533 domain-containing protein n=1 Tax=Piloderma croceum (strain F 1598) TaxID=765440 RepID=A0A0C3FB54_PILCF|nr:hypothetical protein PILCRDRAFT_12476 [Piloderma croceum F 1598]